MLGNKMSNSKVIDIFIEAMATIGDAIPAIRFKDIKMQGVEEGVWGQQASLTGKSYAAMFGVEGPILHIDAELQQLYPGFGSLKASKKYMKKEVVVPKMYLPKDLNVNKAVSEIGNSIFGAAWQDVQKGKYPKFFKGA